MNVNLLYPPFLCSFLEAEALHYTGTLRRSRANKPLKGFVS